jgi:polyhydroxyalkanoate synthesis regulator phasin
MAMYAVFVLCFFQVPFAASLQTSKTSPVSKVIIMLKDMMGQLAKEQEVDDEMMEKMSCWCTTGDKEKTQAIKDGEDKIESLNSVIQFETAAVAEYTEQSSALMAQLEKTKNALAQATELRKKALSEFNAEEKDLLSSIASVKGAIIALSKHHSASFLQESGSALEETRKIAAMLQYQLHTHSDMLSEVITPHQRKAVASLLQSPDDYFESLESVGVHLPLSMRKFMPTKQLMQLDGGEVPGGKYYKSNSGEIMGILKQLKESFEANLESAQSGDMTNNADFEDLKKAKEAEIASTASSLDLKQKALGDASFKKANADEDLEETQNILAADVSYLAELKTTCATADSDYTSRKNTRIEETAAVSKALAFLNSDDAQDLFHKSIGGAFVQKSQISRRVTNAAEVLNKAAKKLGKPEMSALVLKFRLDSFGKAKKAIQDLIKQLQDESKEEIEKKDICISEINTNEAEQEATQRDKADQTEKIDALTANIDTLSKEIAALKAEVAAAKLAFKRAGEDREIENKDFQLTVADQRATQKVLTSALSVLKGFYSASLLERSSKRQPAGPPPPASFTPYEKQAAGGGVMAAIEGVIADAKVMEADAISAEADAQTAYEEFGKQTNDALDAMTRAIITKSGNKAAMESDKTETSEALDYSLATLESLEGENHSLHLDCDYTLKLFDLRQTQRGEEVDALKQALAILGGASFNALLQGDDVTPDMEVQDGIDNHLRTYKNRLEQDLALNQE